MAVRRLDNTEEGSFSRERLLIDGLDAHNTGVPYSSWELLVYWIDYLERARYRPTEQSCRAIAEMARRTMEREGYGFN